MKILVATDGSPAALLAFQRAAAIARTYPGSTLSVLAVTPLPMLELLTQHPPLLGDEGLTGEIHKQLDRQASSWLTETVASEATDPIPLDTRKIMGHPGEVICETAKHGNFELVVVGSHNESKLRRMILGSVSDYVVHHSPCSVLIVKG
jgi:nucleotide-binding universal stress UspA family protein